MSSGLIRPRERESGRSLPHLAGAWEAADATGYFDDPEQSAGRLLRTLAAHGLGARRITP